MNRPLGHSWINAERKLKRLAESGARPRRVRRQAERALRRKDDLIRRLDRWLESRDLLSPSIPLIARP